MSEPTGRHHDDYDPSTLTSVLSTLEAVLRCFGHAREHATIIGGLSPSLLVPVPPGRAHAGTADIDLCLTVALAEGGTGYYDEIGPALERDGFQQRMDPTKRFRWERQGVVVDFLYPAGDGDRPMQEQRRGEDWESAAQTSFGENFAALAVGYPQLISATRRKAIFSTALYGAEIPDASVFVAGPGALAALKAEALSRRAKFKDAYDVVWTLDSFGPDPAAKDTLARISGNPSARVELGRAMWMLADVFSPGRTGPAWYANFVAAAGETDRQRSANERFATETVRLFLDALGGGPSVS